MCTAGEKITEKFWEVCARIKAEYKTDLQDLQRLAETLRRQPGTPAVDSFTRIDQLLSCATVLKVLPLSTCWRVLQ